jgi:hypothetical protein
MKKSASKGKERNYFPSMSSPASSRLVTSLWRWLLIVAIPQMWLAGSATPL